MDRVLKVILYLDQYETVLYFALLALFGLFQAVNLIRWDREDHLVSF